MNEKLAAALDYLERGWSVIPIKPDAKRPAIKWRQYQDEPPTEKEVEQTKFDIAAGLQQWTEDVMKELVKMGCKFIPLKFDTLSKNPLKEILYLIENNKMKIAKSKLDILLKQKNISNNQKNRLSTIDEIYFK